MAKRNSEPRAGVQLLHKVSFSLAQMKFIDLFAGLGGFYQALSASGGECVFASEINADLASLYEKNYGTKPHGDIRSVDIPSIPDHDVLCAGFPCQPFSKAGEQKGLQCPQWGDLIDYVIEILRVKEPRFFIIENVPNLVRHDGGRTWQNICARLRALNYDVDFARLSPHMFGVPQKRERAFIIGDREGLGGFSWPVPEDGAQLLIASVLENNPKDALHLGKSHVHYLTIWQEFVSAFPANKELPSFPIWAMEFGADYPLNGLTPYEHGYRRLGRYKGAFGQSLKGLSPDDTEAALPGYARTKLERFPAWKIDFINKNRAFYAEHRALITSQPMFPSVVSPSPEPSPDENLPDVGEQLDAVAEGERDDFQFEFLFRGTPWVVKLELSYADKESDWLSIQSRPAITDPDPREVLIRVAMLHPFMAQFPNLDSEGFAAVLNIAATMALSEVIAAELASHHPKAIRQYTNEILKNLVTRTVPDE